MSKAPKFNIDGKEMQVKIWTVSHVENGLRRRVDDYMRDITTTGKFGGSLRELLLYKKTAEWIHKYDPKKGTKAAQRRMMEQVARANKALATQVSQEKLEKAGRQSTGEAKFTRGYLSQSAMETAAADLRARQAEAAIQAGEEAYYADDEYYTEVPFYKKPLFIGGVFTVIGVAAVGYAWSKKRKRRKPKRGGE